MQKANVLLFQSILWKKTQSHNIAPLPNANKRETVSLDCEDYENVDLYNVSEDELESETEKSILEESSSEEINVAGMEKNDTNNKLPKKLLPSPTLEMLTNPKIKLNG